MFQGSESDNQTLCTDITVFDDLIYEASESFTVSLTIAEGTTGVGVHIPSATITIVDDDYLTVRFEASSYNAREEEEHVQVCLKLTGRSETMVDCLVSTEPDTAQQGN